MRNIAQVRIHIDIKEICLCKPYTTLLKDNYESHHVLIKVVNIQQFTRISYEMENNKCVCNISLRENIIQMRFYISFTSHLILEYKREMILSFLIIYITLNKFPFSSFNASNLLVVYILNNAR